jgi:multicomponent Na+:H+ antiporter subunit E
MHVVVLFITLAVLWVLWSGLFKPLMLLLGLASCILVVWLAKRFDTLDHESVPVHLGPKIIAYWGWLTKEIVIASLQVTRIVLARNMPISPCMVKVQSKSHGQVRQVLFANSITLTPGTLTTDIDDDGMLTVHALTTDGAQGVTDGPMNDKVAALPGFGDK